jgi:hypothetical protein
MAKSGFGGPTPRQSDARAARIKALGIKRAAKVLDDSTGGIGKSDGSAAGRLYDKNLADMYKRMKQQNK